MQLLILLLLEQNITVYNTTYTTYITYTIFNIKCSVNIYTYGITGAQHCHIQQYNRKTSKITFIILETLRGYEGDNA
jgi:hypothetical protein